MDEKQKTELRKLTEDLKRELRASRDELDAMVALDKGEQRLQKLRGEQKTAGDALSAMDALARAMENAGMDPGLGETMSSAMANGDAAAMSSALAQLNADQMKELAESLTGDAQSLAEQLAEAAGQGEMTDAQMQALMAGSMASGSPLQQAISGMKGSIGAPAQSGSQGTSGSGGQNGAGMSGSAGSGAGTGSTNEEQNGPGSAGQKGTAKGNRPATFKQAEYETIYDPEKVDKASRDVMTEQNSLGKDSVQIETGPGKGTLEGDVPFRQVVGEYAEQEALAAESAHLTREQKEWVDEYFRLLTEE